MQCCENWQKNFGKLLVIHQICQSFYCQCFYYMVFFYQHHKHLYRGGGEGGEEPQNGRLKLSSAIFKVKWPRRPHCTQTVTKMLNPWPISSSSSVVISSKVVACTSQPMTINGHPSTRGYLTGLKNKHHQK